MAENPIRAFWDGDELTEDSGYLIVRGSEWRPQETDGPSLKVTSRPDGFYSVLAQPAGEDRCIALTLDESPSPGTYYFEPTQAGYSFQVKFEYTEEPFPAPKMLTLDLSSELCGVSVGDQLFVGLREDATETPGVKEVGGPVIGVADSCGAVPDFTQMEIPYTEYPLVSILVDISDEPPSNRAAEVGIISPSHKLTAAGDDTGKIDVIGRSEPFELRWEGASDTPALDVEYVTVEPPDGSPWTVRNDKLPDVEFVPLRELTIAERVQELRSAFDRAPDIAVPAEDVLQILADAVDDGVPRTEVSVQYDSPKSDEIQSRRGELVSVQSVYYAEPNRARHQIRFKDSKLHHILVDPHEDAEIPLGIYSKSYARHWDTELGDIRSIDISVE